MTCNGSRSWRLDRDDPTDEASAVGQILFKGAIVETLRRSRFYICQNCFVGADLFATPNASHDSLCRHMNAEWREPKQHIQVCEHQSWVVRTTLGDSYLLQNETLKD
jgi:hypothetical protein